MSRRARALAPLVALVAAVAPTACSSAGEEPAGLDAETTATGSATASPDESEPAPTPTAGGDEPAEPSPTFTQPYLPDGQESVIALPAELPVEPPVDASEAERDVLGALGRFMASWNALLFGADEARSGIEQTSSSTQLDRMREFAADAAAREWVFVGEPMELAVTQVTAESTTATVDVCVRLPQWLEFEGRNPQPAAVPSPERYIVTFSASDDGWIASDTAQQDAASCQ